MSYPYAKSHLAFVAKLCNDRCFWDEKLWSTNDEFFGRCEWMCFVFGECKCSTDKHFSITLMAYRILYLSPKVLSHISTENLYSSKERRRARDAWLTPSNHPSTQPSQNRDSDSFLLFFYINVTFLIVENECVICIRNIHFSHLSSFHSFSACIFLHCN